MTVRYNPDLRGTGQLMRSDGMVGLMEFYAEEGADFARTIAPVGSGRDKHPGAYKESIKVDSVRRGGPHKDRAEARIVADSDHAVNVEWQDDYHVLARAAGYLEARGA